MSGRERFLEVMSFGKPDRLPVWYFGYWEETLARWKNEGLADAGLVAQETGMDPDWENGMWNLHGLASPHLMAPAGETWDIIIEETEDYVTKKNIFGGITQYGKKASSLPSHIKPSELNRETWQHYKHYLNATDPARRPAGWQEKAVDLNARSEAAAFYAGSLYGHIRGLLGLEGISFLCYDDPALFEEVIDFHADFYMRINDPILDRTQFEFGYFFEDCCGKNGPLFSPEAYKKYYDKYYRRMIEFYRGKGVKHILLDSDGKVDAFIPLWLDSGVDILFPVEIGSWMTDPAALRRQYGKNLKMMGGVNKNLISKGEGGIRQHLQRLKPLAMDGGFIPMPDHRIPPDCSLADFKTYITVFKDVFNS